MKVGFVLSVIFNIGLLAILVGSDLLDPMLYCVLIFFCDLIIFAASKYIFK